MDASTSDQTQPPPKKIRKNCPKILDGKFYEVEKPDEISIDGKVSARCTVCNQIRKGNVRSTGNFINHYRSSHLTIFNELEEYLQKPERSDTPVQSVRHELSANPISKEKVCY